MANPNGRKGARWERRLADRLKLTFPFADRRVKTGANDKGDIGGVPGWVVEAKSCQRFELSTWIDQAEKERINAGERFCAVVFPRAGHAVEKAYALMELEQLEDLMVLTANYQQLAQERNNFESDNLDLIDQLECALTGNDVQ